MTESQICNIGARESRKRRLMGIAALASGVGLAFVIVATEVPRAYRLLVFIPFWIACLGMLQSRAQVCIALSARGLRNMDTGDEKIQDQSLKESLRAKSKQINRRALITAAAITLVVLLFPTRIV
ncbi:MAG: hypothetical protein WKF84_07085 [Pyrinomonadaceae bacterium]